MRVADAPKMLTGLHRQCLFGGLRIGLYEPVKTLYMGKNASGPAPFYKKARKAVAPCIPSPRKMSLPGMNSGVFGVVCMLGVMPCMWCSTKVKGRWAA